MDISSAIALLSLLSPYLLAAAVLLAYFWVTQFVQLMLLEDALFPGRFDKALWCAAFLLFWPVTPFAFRAWKSARLAIHAAAQAAKASPETP